MEKEDLWNSLVTVQPVFGGKETEHITQTKRGLKRFFEMAFDAGVKHGRALEAKEQKALQEAKNIAQPPSLFEQFFGPR